MTTLFRLILASAFLAACSTMTVEEKVQKRNELDSMAEQAIAALTGKDAAVGAHLDRSKGYLVADMKLTKVPIVGAGGGEGIFVDKIRAERKYIKVGRFDLGGGWGARAYKALLVIDTDELMDRMRSGTWEFQAGVEASAGSASAEGSAGAVNQGYQLYVLSEAGASATATARVIRISFMDELSEE